MLHEREAKWTLVRSISKKALAVSSMQSAFNLGTCTAFHTLLFESTDKLRSNIAEVHIVCVPVYIV